MGASERELAECYEFGEPPHLRRLSFITEEAMRRVRGYNLLYGASGLMVLGFCISVAVGWYQYNTVLNSAPFWVWIVTDAALWLLPAVLAFLAGFIAKKKLSKKEKTK